MSKKEIKSSDEFVRLEFSKAFRWYKKKGAYDSGYDDPKEILPTWEQIFIELGRLLERQKRLDYITDNENISLRLKELEIAHSELEHNLRSEVHTNLPQSTIKRNFPS